MDITIVQTVVIKLESRREVAELEKEITTILEDYAETRCPKLSEMVTLLRESLI